jgi:hypothetical protein
MVNPSNNKGLKNMGKTKNTQNNTTGPSRNYIGASAAQTNGQSKRILYHKNTHNLNPGPSATRNPCISMGGGLCDCEGVVESC